MNVHPFSMNHNFMASFKAKPLSFSLDFCFRHDTRFPTLENKHEKYETHNYFSCAKQIILSKIKQAGKSVIHASVIGKAF